MTAGELFLQECHYLPQIWSSNIKSKPVCNTDRQGTATAEVKAAFQIWRESVTPEKAWGWKNVTKPLSSLTLTVAPVSNNKNITKNLKTSANVVWLITFVLQQVLTPHWRDPIHSSPLCPPPKHQGNKPCNICPGFPLSPSKYKDICSQLISSFSKICTAQQKSLEKEQNWACTNQFQASNSFGTNQCWINSPPFHAEVCSHQ